MDKSMNIYEVQKVIKRLSALDSFKRYCADDPFAPSAKELTQLQEDVTAMLRSYMNFLREWDAGDLVMKVNDTVTISNPDSNRMGKNAPAYKDDIDEQLIYQLWNKGMSLRKIAEQANCSPDIVKRRLVKMEHGLKEE